MGTTFYGTLLEGSELHGLAEEALAKNATSNEDRHRRFNVAPAPISLNGVNLAYDRIRQEWYYDTDVMLFEFPDYLRDQLPGFVPTLVEFRKGAAPADFLAAYQGQYRGSGRFEGCEATVDNRVDKDSGPRQGITVTGPVEVYAEFYSAIRSRRIYPNIWWEPKLPWGVRFLQTILFVRRG